MRNLPGTMAAFALVLLAANLPVRAASTDESRGKEVPYHVYTSYYFKNNSGLKPRESYHLAITDRPTFDKIFGVAVVMRNKPSVLPEDAFENHMVAAVIKRGNAVWKYQVRKVTAAGGTLSVQYQATPGKKNATAKFASVLVVAVLKGKYDKVVFVENGKEAGTAKVR